MFEEIAALVDSKGYCSILHSGNKIEVYRRAEGKWHLQRNIILNMAANINMRELRAYMGDLADFLGECRILLAERVSGVAYFELERLMISVWEFEGLAQQFLDTVWSEEQVVSSKQETFANTPPKLVETFPGCYRISVKEIQTCATGGLTTKKVLLPLLRRGGFKSLEILCGHVPPWLELELSGGDYVFHNEKLGSGDIKIQIMAGQ